MSARPEYAPMGLIGTMTPQANTTVEPEFARLWPAGYAGVNVRLTSPETDLHARLIAYFAGVEGDLARFADAPLDAIAFACTGSSYLAGRDDEDARVAEIEAAAGVPFVTAARAITDALTALGATRIGLISPYPAPLTAASQGYWESRGFTVAAVENDLGPSATAHPIYGIAAAAAGPVIGRLKETDLDAIVLLGTGLPTLGAIAAARQIDGPPLLSSMLALAWRTIAAVDGRAPDARDLLAWIAARHWGHQFAASAP